MPKNISRRKFFKAGAAVAAGLAASRAPLPQAVRASTPSGVICTVLDLDKCIACGECVSACREQWQETVPLPHGPMPKPFPAKVPIQDWSMRKHVDDRLTPYNFLYLEQLEIDHRGEAKELNIPRRCMHCANPPCVNLCPFGAANKEKNGIVHFDDAICMGGAKCKAVCPWKIPQRQSGVGLYLHILPEYAGNGVMFKCMRCKPLVDKGQTPRCVEACPEEVQSIGPQDKMVAQATALAKKKARADGAGEAVWQKYIYGLEENGGTHTLYVSPVPWVKISEALDNDHAAIRVRKAAKARQVGRKNYERMLRGNMGRPHMRRVENSMERAENLTLALVLAPIAGAAAGALKLWSKLNGDASSGGKERRIMTEPVHPPGGGGAAWLYRTAMAAAIFGGMGQMPIYKRYYITGLPGMAWAADFYNLADLHYIAVSVLLFLFCWRIVTSTRTPSAPWSWGPRTWWGWTLLGLLAISGGGKALFNLGTPMDPKVFLFLTLTHMGTAMAFMITGIVSLFTSRKTAPQSV